MDAKKEQALVGLFVLVASGVLLATIFAITGVFGPADNTYRTFFPFAAGLEPGATVRVGGIKAGRIEALRVDPQDPTRVELTFSLRPGQKIKTDSVAKITSLGALGDNYLEITLGSATAPEAKPGDVVRSKEYFGIADLSDTINELRPKVNQLAENLNKRVEELRVTIERVNDLINDANRAHVAASVSHVREMLEENRPKLKSTMSNVEAASAKMPVLLDDFKKTMKKADEAITRVDEFIGENRPDIRAALAELRKTLASASELTEQLNRTVNYNAENIDELLENIRMTTENLKQFTDTIKARPYTLIRATEVPERKPGQAPRP